MPNRLSGLLEPKPTNRLANLQPQSYLSQLEGALARGGMRMGEAFAALPEHAARLGATMAEVGKDAAQYGDMYGPQNFMSAPRPDLDAVGKKVERNKAVQALKGITDQHRRGQQAIIEAHPEWESEPPKNVVDLITSPRKLSLMLAESTPLLVGAGIVAAAGQPGLSVAMMTAVEGQDMFDQAIADGASPQEAQGAMLIYGPIAGAIEQMQLQGVINVAKGAYKPLLTRTAQKVVAKAGMKGVKYPIIKTAVQEALEEIAQGTVQEATAKAVYKKSVPGGIKGFLDRRAQEGVLGATLGLVPGLAGKAYTRTKGTAQQEAKLKNRLRERAKALDVKTPPTALLRVPRTAPGAELAPTPPVASPPGIIQQGAAQSVTPPPPKAAAPSTPTVKESLTVAQQPAAQQAKQPWEMSREEYIEFAAENKLIEKGTLPTSETKAIAKDIHWNAVNNAVEQGKPVPRAVLEEYKNEAWAQEALAKPAAKEKGVEQALGRSLSAQAIQRLNTLADKKNLKVADLRDGTKGIVAAVQNNPGAALAYALEQSQVDWEDTNFKRNWKKIADHIEKEWPISQAQQPSPPAKGKAEATIGGYKASEMKQRDIDRVTERGYTLGQNVQLDEVSTGQIVGASATAAKVAILDENGATVGWGEVSWGKLDKLNKPQAQQPSPPAKGGFLTIPWETPSPEKLREGAELTYQNYINRFASIENTTKKAKALGMEVKPGEDPGWRARGYLGLGRKVESALQNQTFRTTPEGEVVVTGEGLKPILDDYDKAAKKHEKKRSKREKDFEDYLKATRIVYDLQRSPYEGAPQIATPAQTKAAKKTLSNLAQKYGQGIQVLRDSAQRLYEYQKRILHLLVDAGNLSQQQYDQIVNLNQHYIPFDRVLEEEQAGVPRQKGRFTRARAPIKRIKGSELPIQPPVESIIKNTYVIMDRAERNQVARSLAKFAGILPEEIQPVRAKMVPITVDPKEIVTAVREFRTATRDVMDEIKEVSAEGKDISGPAAKLEKVVTDALTHRGFSEGEARNFIAQIKKGKPLETQKETIRQIIRETQKVIVSKEPLESKIFRPSQFAPKGNIIEYFENGKRKYLRVTPNLYKAMTGLTEESASGLVKIFAKPAHWLRVGATTTLEFMGRNLIKDQFTAFMQTSFGFIPFVDTIGAIADVIGETENYHDWMRSGGAYSGFVELNRPALKKALQKLRNERGLLRKLNIITHAQDISQVVEQATRLAVFKRARKRGKSAIEAGYASREATVDFARRGTKMRDVNQLIAFFGAQIQGFDKSVRSAVKNPYATALKGLIAITLPSLLLYLRNRKEEDYKELPGWRRDLFWNFKAGDRWWSIPKPFLFGQIFGSIPERFMEYIDTKDKDAFDGLAASVYDAVSPIAGDPESGLLPTAIKPIIENATNWNFFLERPVVPESVEGYVPSEQYTRYTTETAKQLGKYLNYSPAKIENLIRGWTGGTGRYALEATDYLVNSIKDDAKGKRPREVSDYPLARGFAPRPPLSQPASVDKFYEERKRIAADYDTYKKMLKEGRKEDARKLKTDRPELLTAKPLEKYADSISTYRKQIIRIEESQKPDAQKREQIRKYEKLRLEKAKRALALIDKYKK